MSPSGPPRRPLPPCFVALALAVVAALGGAAWPAGPASAHAELVATTPTDGAALDQGPARVELAFSEDVSASLGAVRVLDRDGERVDRGDVRDDGSVLSVGVEDLPDGTYVVAWRAVSADSHPIHGSFTFGVGAGAAALDDGLVRSLLGDEGDGPYRAAGAAARLLALGGALVTAGLATFLVLAHDGGRERATLRRLLRIAAAVGAVGVAAELPVRAALATGLGPGALVRQGVLAPLLGERVGASMAVTLLALLFVAVDGGRERLVALGGTLAIGVAAAVSGHTATAAPALVAQGSDAAHVIAGAVWLGGLVGCAVVVGARLRSGEASAPVVVRFSGVAGAAVGLVAVAGAALGWTQVRSLDALMTTPYGRLLLAKVALVALAGLLGGLNRYRIVPVLAATGASDALTARATRVLRRTLALEVALLVLVVGVTAVLVDVTPARAAVAAPFSASAALDEGRVDLDVEPTRVGPTTIHLYAYGPDGQLLADVQSVELRFSLPAAGITDLVRSPEPTGTGHWTLEGDDLSIAGTWTVEVVLRLTVFDQQTASFDVPISP